MRVETIRVRLSESAEAAVRKMCGLSSDEAIAVSHMNSVVSVAATNTALNPFDPDRPTLINTHIDVNKPEPTLSEQSSEVADIEKTLRRIEPLMAALVRQNSTYHALLAYLAAHKQGADSELFSKAMEVVELAGSEMVKEARMRKSELSITDFEEMRRAVIEVERNSDSTPSKTSLQLER